MRFEIKQTPSTPPPRVNIKQVFNVHFKTTR